MADPLPAGLERAAAAVVHAAAGVVPAEVAPIPQGVMTWKLDVALPTGERFIVRFYPPGREEVVRYEPDLLRRCGAAGVPVPLVIADSRSGPPAPLPYVLYRRIEGAPLSARWPRLTRPVRQRVAGDLVEMLARLRSIPIEGYGQLLSAQRAHHQSWAEFVRCSLDEGLEASGRSRLSEDLVDDVTAIRHVVDRVRPPTSSGLVWGDVSPANVLVDRADRLVGLLDFESALGGDLDMNLGYCRAGHLGTSFYDAVRAAWPTPPTGEESARIDLYAVVRGMRIARYDHQPHLPAGQVRKPVEEFLPGLRRAAADLRAAL